MCDVDAEAWCHGHGFQLNVNYWIERFERGDPFPHLVIENFLPLQLAEDVYESFPSLEDKVWTEQGSHYVVPGGVASKFELGHKPSFPIPIARTFDSFLFHPTFVKFLECIDLVYCVRHGRA
jgi:hypothetical protein